MDSSIFDPESSSSLAEDASSAHSLSPSPTNDANYQDIYDDPRPNAPRQLNYAQSPSEAVVNHLPDLSVRAYVGSRFSTAALAQGPDGSRVVVAGKDTLRILRVEDAEVPQPTGYLNFSPSPSPLTTHAEASNTSGLRNSRTYAAAAASDANEGLGASKFTQKGRRTAKSLSRYGGPNESAVFDDTNLWAGVGAKLGFQSPIVDVEWSHQSFSNTIITAFGAGELVSWDLNKSTGSKVDKSIRDAHMRAINCIRVSPTNGAALLTASQDGYVKYWDLRNFKSPSTIQIPHHGTAVRALAFSPGFETTQALVGLEIGVLLRYDLRMARSALDRLPTAHSSAILSIDWQSVGNGNTSGWAATAGMDKTVKIWDTSTAQMSTHPTHTLHTTHAVKQAAWRPGHDTELAIVHLTPGISPQKASALAGTTSLGGIDMSLQIHAHGAKTPMLSSSPASHYGIRGPHHRQRALSHSESIVPSMSAENLTQLGSAAQLTPAYDGDADHIEIWDVRRSWVAKYVLSDNISDGPVTELVWPSGGARPGGALWVAYTGGAFAQHDLRNVFRPLDSVPRSGVTWETRGVVAFAVDAVERGEIPYDDVRPDARNLFTSRGGKDKAVSDPPYVPRTQVKGSVPIPSFELGVFVKLARGYILGGEASREDICLHNAQVALEASQYRASQAWQLLRSLLTPIVPEGPVAPQLDVAAEYASGRSHPVNLPSTHTPSPRSNQGSRAPSSGPPHGSLQRKSQSPRHRYPSGRHRRPTAARRASRGSASGSSHSHGHSHSRPTTRSRSVSVDSNSSLKHVGGGALDDESDSSDGDIAESESEGGRPLPKSSPSPSGPSGISLVRPFASPLGRRIRNVDMASTSLLSAPNEADEHDLSLMGPGGSSDEHLPTDSEPLHNSPTSDAGLSEADGESDVYRDGDIGPNTTSLATLKPETTRRRALRRQDSRSSIGTAKPSLHPDDTQIHTGRPVQGVGARRVSPATSRTHSLPTNRNRLVSDPLRSGKTPNQTLFPDRGRSRKPRKDVCEAEEKYRQMGWEAMRETVVYYSDRGDLQMSAMLSSIGGPELGIPPEAHERLVDAYLDLLSRLRLYAPAAYVRKYAKSRDANQATTSNTIIYSACTRCGKSLTTTNQTKGELNGQYGFCAKCKRFASQCSICRLPVRGLYFMCSECSHGGHQECYRSYYLSRPLVNLDGSSTAANSRTNTILESDTRSTATSVLSLTTTDPDKPADDTSSLKTEKTLDMSVTDPSNRNSLEIVGQESRNSADWTPRGHPCAAGCGHFCWASNDRGPVEVQ